MSLEFSRRSAERALVLAVSLAYAAPLALCRFFPGLDLPWHTAVVAILSESEPGRFLGAFGAGPSLSSYQTLYFGASALARLTGDAAIAVQIILAAYVIAFVWGARRLALAFGGSGLVALLAAPAAYSLTLDYGFLTYALGYPLTFFLWAMLREIAGGERAAPRLVAAGLLSAALALTHPFAAAVGVSGGLVLLALELSRDRALRLGAAALVLVLGAAPAALAVGSIASAPWQVPQAAAHLPLWDRLTLQSFVRADESVAAAPARLFGASPLLWRYALLWLGLAAALFCRRLAGAPPGGPSRRAPWLLLLFAVALYLITPYTFWWPRYWYAAQPRLLPLCWVLLLVCLRPRAGAASSAARWPPLAVAAAALAVIAGSTLVPFSREARDFTRVIARAAPRARTLGLIEQRPARDREPASPFRHFTAYVMVEKGGVASNLPIGDYTGMLAPVRRLRPPPPAPALGRPRTFDFARYGAGWDQFLIRDLDPAAPFDYFRGHAGEVELVARAGRWRLYRKRSDPAGTSQSSSSRARSRAASARSP